MTGIQLIYIIHELNTHSIAIGGRLPAVLLNSPSTRKDGRLGGATIHTNVKSLTQFYHAAVLA